MKTNSKDRERVARVKEGLREERGFFKSLLKNIPDLVWLKDPQGVYLACNSSIERLIGRKEADILGRTDYDFFDSNAADLFRSKDLAAIETGSPTINNEWVTFSDNGQKALFETIKTPMFDDTGQLIGVLGIARDITEMHEAREAQRESEERCRTLAEASFEGIVMSEKGIISDCNDQIGQMLGYSREEIIGSSIARYVAPEDVDRVMGNILKGIEVNIDLELQRKDGSLLPVEVHGRTIAYQGKSRRITIVRDLSGRKQREEQLRQRSSELEESNSALKVLLKQREDDKREVEEKVVANIRQLVLPYIEMLKSSCRTPDQQRCLHIVESNLDSVMSSFSVNFAYKMHNLSPKELRVCGLIKDGKQDKEIADILILSIDTVKAHRRNIRKKLGLKGKKANLRVYLASY